MKKVLYSTLALTLCTIFSANAQSLIDGFTPAKGELSVVLGYTYESYNQFYLGDQKLPIEKTGVSDISKNTFGVYAEYGITDRFGLVLNAPYISSKTKSVMTGEDLGEGQIQDASLFAEYKIVNKNFASGNLSLIGALGVSVPLSNYMTDQIYAIGSHATAIMPVAVLQYKLNNGLFANAQAGYNINTNKVPDAFNLSAKIGYGTSRYYLAGYIASKISTSGIDIGSPGFSPELFPQTKVNTTGVGLNAYVKVYEQFGITAGAGVRFAGRNAGLPKSFSVGLVYKMAKG